MSKSEKPPLDPVAQAIIDTLAGGATPTFQDVAKAIGKARAKPKDGPEAWRRYLTAVRQQALYLARQGTLEFTRRGEAVSPDDLKGVVKMRLPQNSDPNEKT